MTKQNPNTRPNAWMYDKKWNMWPLLGIYSAVLALLLFAACEKEPTAPPCDETKPGKLEIKNSLHVRMECILFYQTTIVRFGLNPSESTTSNLEAGSYLLNAEGSEGGPFSHNTYSFSERVQVGGCAGDVVLKIE